MDDAGHDEHDGSLAPMPDALGLLNTEVEVGAGTLARQVATVHDRVRAAAPAVDRVACALYDPRDDLLKTFVSSTASGVALHGYQYRLADSESLGMMARTGRPRLLDDLPHQLRPSTAHSRYVLDEGYVTSFTVPMVHRGDFLGFVFFDSRSPGTFTPELVRELVLHAAVVTMAVAGELTAVASVVGTVQIARDFTRLRDHETGAHLDRMARYSRLMARDCAAHFGLGDDDVEHLMLYAPMHDIGKIGVPDHVLLKHGPLEPDEWEQMKLHTVKGAQMVDSILRDLRLVDLPDEQMLRDVVELHHEKLDGSGYPHGLTGDEVPASARIVATADVFDALTSTRPYKLGWSTDDALAELRRQAVAGALDPACVDALVGARDEVEEVRTGHPDVGTERLHAHRA